MKRHIAKLANTDQRCVVLFMQIPERESHALVCTTDNLPPRLEQALMDIVESPEGQANATFANVLGRRLLPDTGENVMQALHQRGYLQPVPIDNVLMLPMPKMPFPLRQIIEQMGGTVPTTTQSQTDASAADTKFNPHGAINQTETSAEAEGTANNLLVEAQLLESEAQLKRERAYRLAPHLRPTVLETPIAELTKEAPAKKPARRKAAK